jgi:hypothetical protein
LVLLARSEAGLNSKLLDHTKDQVGEKGVAELTEGKRPPANTSSSSISKNEEVKVERFAEDV